MKSPLRGLLDNQSRGYKMTISALTNDIAEHINDNISEYDLSDFADVYELHNEMFNTDYFIIGTHKAKTWLGESYHSAMLTIHKYESDIFGTLHTDLCDPEKVVNMFVYIIGETLLVDALTVPESSPLNATTIRLLNDNYLTP